MRVYRKEDKADTARSTIRVNNKAAVYSNTKGEPVNQSTKQQKGKR